MSAEHIDVKEQETEDKAIVLNRMYSGDYLSSNLGHEVINLYADDQGNHYLYLNATGDFAEKHKGKIGYMLLTMYVCQGVVEVLGVATELHDVYNWKKQEREDIIEIDGEKSNKNYGDITYGGVPLLDIFNDAEQQDVFVTYRASKLYVPVEKRVFLLAQNCNNDERSTFMDPIGVSKPDILPKQGKLSINLGTTSLKQYIYPNETPDDYRIIKEGVINQLGCADLWKESRVKVSKDEIKRKKFRDISLFDICRLQNSELSFSNALSFFMQSPKYKELWREFIKSVFQKQNEDFDISSQYSVSREENTKIEIKGMNTDNIRDKHGANGGRIDLFIRDYDNGDKVSKYIIIENKIESDINKSAQDTSEINQLERYWNYAKWLASDGDKSTCNAKVYACVLYPNYSHIDTNIQNPHHKDIKYIEVTYHDLFTFLKKRKEIFEDDMNFVAFFEAMERHTFSTVSKYMKHEMEEKFYSRIKEANKA